MSPKIGGVIAAIAVAMCLAGRIGNVKAGLGWQGSSAWAQEAQGASYDAAVAQDAVSDAADNSEAKAKPTPKPTPVSASGVYSGTVTDANGGAGTISAAISQIKTKIIGTWQDTFVPPAFINGTMNAKGAMSLRMRFYLRGNCGYLFTGTFKNGNEISGTYKLSACPRSIAPDHGTLDMLKQ